VNVIQPDLRTTSRDLRAPQRHPARAETLVLRRPVAPPLSLEDTLAAVGIRGRRKRRTKPHGLLWRWFAHESSPLALLNVAVSAALFAAAITMTALGMDLAVALNMAPAVYAVLNDGLPYLALALFGAAVFKAAHATLDYKAPQASRVIGWMLAIALVAGGLWIETMLGYAQILPLMFKPVLWLAGGEKAAKIASFNRALVAYFEPGLIGCAATLLTFKLTKTAFTRRAPRLRRRLAFAGVAASLVAALISADAAWRHHTGADRRAGLSFAIGGDTLSGRDSAYGPLFAPGVRCHLSSLYGWRDDPLARRRRPEHHQGIDIGVKWGTPVQAMADGTVMFAQRDPGLGNFVAVQTDGPVIVNGHMSKLLVRPGEQIHRGELIGLAGSTGKSTGPHVHLQLCPSGHMRKRGFVCGGATNPYENWPTLSALAHMSCVSGPQVF
jgi:murein DD-endopeptidase MepM/ murein hydrolase activator NlpD